MDIDDRSGATLLDEVIADHEFRGAVEVTVRASPRAVFRALRRVTLDDMPLAHALGVVRYLPGRLLGRGAAETPRTEPFLQQIIDRGNVVLAESPDREIVLGAIGKFHQMLDQEPVKLTDAWEFYRFNDGAYQKLVTSVRAEPVPGGVRVLLEHRTHGLSAASRRAFRRYWAVIEPMGNFVSRLLLRAVRKLAEADVEVDAGVGSPPRPREDSAGAQAGAESLAQRARGGGAPPGTRLALWPPRSGAREARQTKLRQ